MVSALGTSSRSLLAPNRSLLTLNRSLLTLSAIGTSKPRACAAWGVGLREKGEIGFF